MLMLRLHTFLTSPSVNKSGSQKIFWLTLSITFAVVYGILGLLQAFNSKYIIQDDARQHVFWMQRFLDPQLFPDDLIANYFQSVAPLGYTNFYKTGAFLGIDPLWLSKILPLFLGIITTIYCFGVCTELLSIPITGFIGSLLLNQNLWMQDGLISATPKAFIYPIFLAFLYYLLRRSLLPFLIAIALLGLFYPSLILVGAGILVLQIWQWQNFKLQFSQNRQDYLFCFVGLGISLLVLLPYFFSSSEFGPTITGSQARLLPEFSDSGRAGFFNDQNPWQFWFNASRSGIRLSAALMPPLVYAGFLLPILLLFTRQFPLSKHISRGIILPQIILASFAIFFIAHIFIFKLHLPSRYTQHSLRIVMVTTAAIALTLILDTIFIKIKNSQKLALAKRYFLTVPLFASCLLLVATLVLYPASLQSFLWTGYVVGNEPELYEFFQQQPKDILIASLADEANNLPTFSQRSILVGSEYAIPYHIGYYQQFRQRSLELIQAQYSSNLQAAQQIIKKYKIDFWLLQRNAFTPEYIASDRWIKQHKPLAKKAIKQMQQGNIPALSKIISQCSVFETESLVVLSANCIQETQL